MSKNKMTFSLERWERDTNACYVAGKDMGREEGLVAGAILTTFAYFVFLIAFLVVKAWLGYPG